ncbi:MAG: MFS transporter [Alphaproteobacteria bacterium]|nr:MFS transporter [Alphaproteobacteria bacterium]MCB9696571.1 MFS transporter [Alphaproteobacteria bacterium]
MSVVSRAGAVERNLLDALSATVYPGPAPSLDVAVRPGSGLTARRAIGLFESQIESRVLDLLARELKNANQSYYTIGSSGHEGNAAVADVLRSDDPAFLHYRSGAFFCARAAKTPGAHGPMDVLLGLVASIDEPIAGGRHKVFGSVPLCIPPQTSTIASHLPKAVGNALSMDRLAHLERRDEERIAVCTFGDASANHATAQAAFNAAGWATHQNVPVPLLFVCEDNGIGISVRTPAGWIAAQFRQRAGLRYFSADGLDLADAWDGAERAQAWVRENRKPAFLHLRTIRLMGHAGSDVEQLYRTPAEIAATEAMDPLLATGRMLVEGGFLTPDEAVGLWESTRVRLRAMADEALRRPKLTTREAVVAPLFRQDPATVARVPVAPEERRQAAFGTLPETEERARHLAMQINRALLDLMLADPRTLLFGEDVARKGGVYHVTAELSKKLGLARVFNTLLDETSILGMAIGAAHAGFVPFPEIQYLAYLINAVDQLRGEAGSMSFFSNGQYSNGMVVRIAGLAYQKGFGGHFHNDNGIASLTEIPGILVGCPARPDDAVRMLRTLYAAARHDGRLCVFLEPIALYMTKDLHEDGDGAWLATYPAPHQALAIGEVGVYGAAEGRVDLCVITYANGLWMSLRVAKRLEAEGYRVRVIDLRWLHPLPFEDLVPHARDAGRVLVVDECRASSGVADALVADLVERVPGVVHRRVVGADTYIPLAAAANLVLVQEPEIEQAARELLVGVTRSVSLPPDRPSAGGAP